MDAGSASADKGVVSAVCSSFQSEKGIRLREKLQLAAEKQKKLSTHGGAAKNDKVIIFVNK